MSDLINIKDIVIRQANALTTAAYSLSRNEKRLVYIALNLIINKGVSRNDLGQYPVEIKHTEYVLIFDDSSKNVSRDILMATKSLNKKEVIFYLPEEDSDSGERALDGISWTTKRSHRPKRGMTTVFFNAELIDIITKVDKNFTRFLMGEAGKLNSPYSMRLYESLRQWPNRQSVTFSIDWMIERYELPASYTRMSDFRRRFLKPAIQEINEHTSMTITYTEISDKLRANRIGSIKFKYVIEKEKPENNRQIIKIVDLSIDDAIKTYSDLMNKERLPSTAELNNLMSFMGQLMLEGFEFGAEFLTLFKTAQDANSQLDGE